MSPTKNENQNKALQAIKLPLINYKKFIPGILLVAGGIIFTILYMKSFNYAYGGLAIALLAPGLYLAYSGFNFKRREYVFKGEDEFTGKENAIVIYARRSKETGLDIPYRIAFKHFTDEQIKRYEGARPRLLRNLNKHFYEYRNDTGEGKTDDDLIPVEFKDINYLSPEDAKVPSNMQAVKEYLEYNPPSAMQKVSAAVLIIAIVVVGLLIVMTTDNQSAPHTAKAAALIWSVLW